MLINKLLTLCGAAVALAASPAIVHSATAATSSAASSVAAASSAAMVAPPTFRGEVLPDSVEIGDLFRYVITAEVDRGATLAFPQLGSGKPSDNEPVELVSEGEVEIVEQRDSRVVVRKEYLLQAFSDGDINLGVATILHLSDNQQVTPDTLRGTDSLRLHVYGFEIDSLESATVRELKPQRDMPFRFAEVREYLIYLLVAILLVVVVIYLTAKYLERRGKSLSGIFAPPPPPAPHVEAITALQSLYSKKLWQSQQYKLYYSSLTDILRHYLSRRYEINAMEMTSDEIIAAMRSAKLSNKASMNLATLLREADLVKFAKATPSYEESEADYLKAYYLVEETKLLESTNSGEDELSVIP